ncbi:glycosyltransferase [Hoeflea sp. G2-23]|uniref:Glycosyltransferase n=1 Tax=Hoeflea algicola TaxID=2983763 RepID=A0ABT3ZDB7_9HYPH|nr:glycosyltransferase family 2 protein [Hoeflea algicola]MCY0149777.1 glycosyltransferase [Hoeflea algicola]
MIRLPVAATDRKRETREARFFLDCGIGKPHVDAALAAANANATTVEKELLAEGLIEPELYYRWLAGELGLNFIDRIDPAEVVRLPSMDTLLHRDGPLRLWRDGRQLTVIVPEARRLEAENARLAATPELRGGLAVASPATIRKAVWQAAADDRVRQTTFQLDQDYRHASARQVLTGAQGFVLALVLCLGLAGLLLHPVMALLALHVVLTLFFSGGIMLRLTALAASVIKPAHRVAHQPAAMPLPIYTVLIALLDEAEMVPAIVSRIDALDWPKSRLDIKYICEVGDRTTLAALEAQALGPECEIVMVPDFGPRTKPKALQYAFKGARGSLVAVYDAEDKPAPRQLREASARFALGDDRLACLQAPLAIANMRTNWISGLFALEYSGLFRVLIPFLARTGMPIPLGGTSNHFRRAALEAVGGWDPHNVTEDADLGLRLYAHGYRTGTIASATVEAAPVALDAWTRQRTRWLKGWAQTWLVIMRQPLKTCRSLGMGGFAVFQLMIAGMLVSALAHPLMYVFVCMTLAWLATTATVSPLHTTLMWLDLYNIAGSYLTFAAMGWRGFTGYERRRLKCRWLLLAPVYWLLMSFAGWRALAQLRRDAHLCGLM